MLCKDPQTVAFRVENLWLEKSITINEGDTLETLLNRWGIKPSDTFLSDKEMEKCVPYEYDIIDVEDADEDVIICSEKIYITID